MYLLNKSVYFCWCSGTSQLCRPFSTQPKASSMSGTRCSHPNPAQPRPGEPSRKEPAPHRSSGHVLPSHTQGFHLRFIFTQAMPTGKAPVSLWAVVSPARHSRGRSPAAARAAWGSLGFVPWLPRGLWLYQPPQILQSSIPVGPRGPGPGFSGFHYVTPYYFDDSAVLLNHHPSNINYICIREKKKEKSL